MNSVASKFEFKFRFSRFWQARIQGRLIYTGAMQCTVQLVSISIRNAHPPVSHYYNGNRPSNWLKKIPTGFILSLESVFLIITDQAKMYMIIISHECTTVRSGLKGKVYFRYIL